MIPRRVRRHEQLRLLAIVIERRTLPIIIIVEQARKPVQDWLLAPMYNKNYPRI